MPIPAGPAQGDDTTQPRRFVKVKDKYQLEDFRIVVKLGKGAFGNVYLVELDPSLNAAQNQQAPLQFAMKVIDKATIFSQ